MITSYFNSHSPRDAIFTPSAETIVLPAGPTIAGSSTHDLTS